MLFGLAAAFSYAVSFWIQNRWGGVGELGPGDSVGIGLTALLAGAAQYVGLDIVPFSARADLENIFEELVELYARRVSIPDDTEFPRVRPRLESYQFPNQLIDLDNLPYRAEQLRGDLRMDLGSGQWIDYRAPWNSSDVIAEGSLDLIFSQAVLEHVDGLEETYQAMSTWLKPGGYASHVIDFSAYGLSPFWNGHWAYSEKEWRLVRGHREFLLNRCPLSVHVNCAKRAGFEILRIEKNPIEGGLSLTALTKQFQTLDAEDLRVGGAVMILRKDLILRPESPNTGSR